MYACIAASSRNPDQYLTDASIKFHEKLGFTNAGYFQNCAQKFGCWYNIVYMQKNLLLEYKDEHVSSINNEVVDDFSVLVDYDEIKEKNYSLSVIDYYSLLNYKGEELKPGYGIQINTNEYYDESDDIYTALKQYLFITDISYTLRKDDDLNITVNSVKYQEKLLQSLVKLIR